MERRDFMTAGLSASAILAAGPAFAEWAPRRPINAILPYSAGGGTDALARAAAAAAEGILPVPLVIVNRPGSSGITGATEAAAARPDGNTVMVTSAGSFLLTSMLRDTDVTPFDSFEIIAQIGNLTPAVIVPANSPFQSVQDLVDAANANPGALRWAHNGRGGFHHVAGQSFLDRNGLEAQDVPFQGGGPTRAAVIGEQVDFAFVGIQQAAGFENELRVLALAAPERDAIRDDVPTLPELGFDYVAVSSPIVFFAPIGSDPEVISGMEAALEAITQTEQFADQMRDRGNVPAFLSGADTEARLRLMQEQTQPVIDALRSQG
ncbi:Bug family tripartite tricarboxylate transporter substrate binding protein [Jannaschia sp. CCS1]|uniref:Bug family tripartite tricarboxylate transporter substrate binding protein n=1 Tax=Jannaschia sp. (strain CCS1) TaxID=290400 RepID=UPI0000539FF6|nr:tripartite tricarboxylate transporter substrate binding protein [Jannaschia sp. CCS1]ABD53645.1 Twin-arginine translocation pathway signal [Jannaschia sp. CCS1]